jgi:hypothetical protein
VPSHKIDRYQLLILDKQRNYNFQNLGNRHPDAQIVLWTSDGWFFRVYFMPESEPLPKHYDAGDKRANVFLSARQYSWCVDLLRNEAPQSIVWEGTNFYLTTGSEAVGEGDD